MSSLFNLKCSSLLPFSDLNECGSPISLLSKEEFEAYCGCCAEASQSVVETSSTFLLLWKNSKDEVFSHTKVSLPTHDGDCHDTAWEYGNCAKFPYWTGASWLATALTAYQAAGNKMPSKSVLVTDQLELNPEHKYCLGCIRWAILRVE
jgi:hypothetical protein